MRPMDDNYFDLWAERYSYFRRFVPHFLKNLEFVADRHHESLLQAVELLKKINNEGKKKNYRQRLRPLLSQPNGSRI